MSDEKIDESTESLLNQIVRRLWDDAQKRATDQSWGENWYRLRFDEGRLVAWFDGSESSHRIS